MVILVTTHPWPIVFPEDGEGFGRFIAADGMTTTLWRAGAFVCSWVDSWN